jgi:hypothetical protein
MRFAGAPTWDRFGRQKVFSNKSAVLARNGNKKWGPVTTSHLFWPNQRSKAASLLPIWLRNPEVLGPLARPDCREGGGGLGAPIHQEASTEKCARNFLPNGSPLPLLKKNVPAQSARIPNKEAFGAASSA